jgi:hypothetical protein
MLKLLYVSNIQGLPQAKCLKHDNLNINITPLITETSGKTTAVWACSVCESEGAKGTEASYLLETKRKIKLEK